MNQPQPAECTTCYGENSSCCPTCHGTGTQPAALPLDRDAIQARYDAATPGPWGYADGGDCADIVADYQPTGRGSYTFRQHIARIEADWHFDDPQHADCEDEDAAAQALADAEFIAHAHADVPALLARVRELEAATAAVRARATAAAPAADLAPQPTQDGPQARA